jgi:hypothetical protein
MTMCAFTDVDWAGLTAVVESPSPSERRRRRIMAALGLTGGPLPRVDDETLSRYYKYLSATLPLPFTAYYPEPKDVREGVAFRCTVLELLDPAVYLGDGFDGIFCKTRKGRYEINLPLIELEVPQDSLSFQLVDDFWYWFWNWR